MLLKQNSQFTPKRRQITLRGFPGGSVSRLANFFSQLQREGYVESYTVTSGRGGNGEITFTLARYERLGSIDLLARFVLRLVHYPAYQLLAELIEAGFDPDHVVSMIGDKFRATTLAHRQPGTRLSA